MENWRNTTRTPKWVQLLIRIINKRINFVGNDSLKNEMLLKQMNTKPEIAFLLDDVSIEEKEAISYLLFNKNMNQLDSHEETSMNVLLHSIKKIKLLSQKYYVGKPVLSNFVFAGNKPKF